MNTIETDGCTGFPDQIGEKDLTYCCGVHDLGGSDGQLLDCLTALDPTSWIWIMLVTFGVLIMRMFKPIYNFLQRVGILPKTHGSDF